ncbi:hypothetical protein [Lachnoclostridium phytofermentans]|uniref:Membrane protein n=1 Tax=Lachnoclostridium phytofermentans (strain ATCC 700394 / DSM 18823 / ISDg) TaxID=357809 RepID=A9KI62_LACP7|nr:hypothetical protein [Lachnoclostridium phytofermentans]ABX40896.1 membrane protein [Lachnoclostridium phytofermentans ISDg]
MKTARLVIGIISMVLFAFVSFQSCAAGVGNALVNNGESSGSAGMLIAFCFLIAGIVGVATRNKGKGGPMTAGVFYALGGIMGLATSSTLYGDLKIWAILSLIFAAVFILGALKQKTENVPNA